MKDFTKTTYVLIDIMLIVFCIPLVLSEISAKTINVNYIRAIGLLILSTLICFTTLFFMASSMSHEHKSETSSPILSLFLIVFITGTMISIGYSKLNEIEEYQANNQTQNTVYSDEKK